MLRHRYTTQNVWLAQAACLFHVKCRRPAAGDSRVRQSAAANRVDGVEGVRRYEQVQHYPPGSDSRRRRSWRPDGAACRRASGDAGRSIVGCRCIHRAARHCRRCLPVHRRAAVDQRTRDLHDHQRIDDAAGGAGGDGCGRSEVRAPRRADRGGRRAARDPDGRRVGDGVEWVLGRADARNRRLRGRWQPGPARPAAEPDRIPEGRGRHSHALAQRLRRCPPLGRRPRRRGLDDGGVRGGARAANGADLHSRRAERGQQSIECEGDRADREGEGRPDSRRCRCRDPDDPERPLAERRDARCLQRRQVPARTADGWPVARAKGSRKGGVGSQRAPPRCDARAEGGQGRRDRHADGGRDVGEARSRRRVETLDRLARSHLPAGFDGCRRDDHRKSAERVVEPDAFAANSVGSGEARHQRRSRCETPF